LRDRDSRFARKSWHLGVWSLELWYLCIGKLGLKGMNRTREFQDESPPIGTIETSSITKFHEVLRQAEPAYAMLKELKKKVLTCLAKGTIIGDAEKLKGVEEFKRRRPFPSYKDREPIMPRGKSRPNSTV
jgi:hypothetical protein